MIIATPKNLKMFTGLTVLAVTLALLPGGAAPAAAKGIGGSSKSFSGKSFSSKIVVGKKYYPGFRYRNYVASGLVVTGLYGASQSCYWLKVRARNSGSAYWWDRYNACIEGE
jgi:hypothetical protein